MPNADSLKILNDVTKKLLALEPVDRANVLGAVAAFFGQKEETVEVHVLRPGVTPAPAANSAQ